MTHEEQVDNLLKKVTFGLGLSDFPLATLDARWPIEWQVWDILDKAKWTEWLQLRHRVDNA